MEPEDLSELNEEEQEIVKQAQVTDNPFSGTGRPFSNDNELMSERYFQENPANSTAPYSGETSYSINTTAPYRPPGSGLENPSQNVGPYSAPATMPGTTDGDFDEDDLQANVGQDTDKDAQREGARLAYVDWENNQWYDGNSNSIYNHIATGDGIRVAAENSGDAVTASIIEAQLDVLRKVASEIDESNLDEYLDAIPGGTVALEYDDLQDAGMMDPNSFLHTTAATMINDAATTNWDDFSVRGAKYWVANKINSNPGLLNHEIMTREAAVDYIKEKTMVVLDSVHRAHVIDGFVTNVERYRREASNRLHEAFSEDKAIEDYKEDIRQTEAARQVLAVDIDEFLPGEYTEQTADFVDGELNIGDDDGSFMYEAARETINTASDREWSEFTTEGAAEWFFENVAASSMAKHADITYRAAREFVEEETRLLKSASTREEIVRAFTESVEYLREQEVSTPSRTASVETNEFDEIYSTESTILW